MEYNRITTFMGWSCGSSKFTEQISKFVLATMQINADNHSITEQEQLTVIIIVANIATRGGHVEIYAVFILDERTR